MSSFFYLWHSFGLQGKQKRRTGGKYGKQEKNGGVVQEPFATFKKRRRENWCHPNSRHILVAYSFRTPTSFLASLGPDGGQEGSLSPLKAFSCGYHQVPDSSPGFTFL